jgi:hypothetical protein
MLLLADPVSLVGYLGSGILGALRGNLRLALALAGVWAIAMDIVIWFVTLAGIPLPFPYYWLVVNSDFTRNLGGLPYFVRIAIGVLLGYAAYLVTRAFIRRRA